MTAGDLALFLHLLGVVTMVAGIAIAGVTHPLARRAGRVVDIAVLLRTADGDITPQLRGLLDNRPATLANLASRAAMLGVLWLMVTKPG